MASYMIIMFNDDDDLQVENGFEMLSIRRRIPHLLSQIRLPIARLDILRSCLLFFSIRSEKE